MRLPGMFRRNFPYCAHGLREQLHARRAFQQHSQVNSFLNRGAGCQYAVVRQ